MCGSSIHMFGVSVRWGFIFFFNWFCFVFASRHATLAALLNNRCSYQQPAAANRQQTPAASCQPASLSIDRPHNKQHMHSSAAAVAVASSHAAIKGVSVLQWRWCCCCSCCCCCSETPMTLSGATLEHNAIFVVRQVVSQVNWDNDSARQRSSASVIITNCRWVNLSCALAFCVSLSQPGEFVA